MLDIFLACARKEPHYRIYFLAFAWYYAGKTLLRPDCDAPAGSATPEPFVSIPIFLYPSSPRNNYFCQLSSALRTLCKSPSAACFPSAKAKVSSISGSSLNFQSIPLFGPSHPPGRFFLAFRDSTFLYSEFSDA
jgi:hypothetical protein